MIFQVNAKCQCNTLMDSVVVCSYPVKPVIGYVISGLFDPKTITAGTLGVIYILLEFILLKFTTPLPTGESSEI